MRKIACILFALGTFLGLPTFLTAQDARLAFDVATIKPSAGGGTSTRHSADQIAITNQTLRQLIVLAYEVQPFQVTAPEWTESLRFDVTAKYPPGTKFDDRFRMLRTLLEDRMGLVSHRETKEVSGYALLVDKSGFKLKPSDPGEGSTTGGSQGRVYNLVARKISMPVLAYEIGDSLGEAVVDKTGLDGVYDFRLRWAIDNASGPVDTSAEPAPSIFTALPAALGLTLQRQKVSVDSIVVDHVNRVPTEN